MNDIHLKQQMAISLVVLFLILPFNIIHELGHGFICALYGNDYSITLSLFSRSNTTCQNNNFNQIIYGMIGGLVVMLLSLLFLIIPSIRNSIGARIGFFSLATMSLGNAIFEGFLFEFYNQNILLSEFVLYIIWFISITIQWTIILKQN